MNFIRYVILVLAGALFFTSCDSTSGDTAPGILQVMLTDAPGDYEAVIIDIQEVRVHKQSDAEDGENGWITINTQPVTADLLKLTNGNMEVLGEAELEPGTYNQMRFILGDENEVVIDGQSHNLNTPSGQQSGLKLQINAEIESNTTYTLLLDFDASRSIVRAGASGIFNLKPVIRTVNLTEAGAISGSIQPAEALSWIYIMADQDTVAGTRANENGDFLIIGLQSDSYQVSLVPTHDDYDPAVIPNVEVSVPDTTDLGEIEF